MLWCVPTPTTPAINALWSITLVVNIVSDDDPALSARAPGPCLTTAIRCCRKPLSQWQRSFQRKLRSHWLKFLQQRHVEVVRQGPACCNGHICIPYIMVCGTITRQVNRSPILYNNKAKLIYNYNNRTTSSPWILTETHQYILEIKLTEATE